MSEMEAMNKNVWRAVTAVVVKSSNGAIATKNLDLITAWNSGAEKLRPLLSRNHWQICGYAQTPEGCAGGSRHSGARAMGILMNRLLRSLGVALLFAPLARPDGPVPTASAGVDSANR